MHASSLENMQKCYERFLGRSALLNQASLRLLDVGANDVNGSYRTIFSDSKFDYLGVDLEEGPGVDLVLEDPYTFPFPDQSFDLVLCGQVFEHAEFFWKLFEEMVRVLQPSGLLFLLVPSAGPIHRYPVDCYRFYPDAMRALAKYTNVNLLDTWLDSRGPWKDLSAVFSPQSELENENVSATALPDNEFLREVQASTALKSAGLAEENLVQGAVDYLPVLAQLHEILEPRLYLEIGIRHGDSFSLAQCESIGVDPAPKLETTSTPMHRVYTCTSDVFFEVHAKEEFNADTDPKRAVDLAFIDGMHLFEYALRDFIHIERYANSATLVIIDDIFPNHPVQASRLRQSTVWTGDVWKLYACLSEARPDLTLLPVDTKPTGLLLVAGLNPNDTILNEHYNLLVRKYRDLSLPEGEHSPLVRPAAIAPADPRIPVLVQALREERQYRTPSFAARLKAMQNQEVR